MSTGGDSKRRLSIPAARPLKRSTSSSPLPTKDTHSKASTSTKAKSTTNLNPIATRSTVQKTISVSAMALNDFISVTDRLVHFEARINKPTTDSPSLYTLQVRRDQVKSHWQKIEDEYERCTKTLNQASGSSEFATMEAKYDFCYSIYESCVARLNQQIDAASSTTRPTDIPAQPPAHSSGCRLPPVDTEIFDGDYLRWPTFRDLFTAIYVHNPRLTPVEMLFHLNAKTSGEAKSIVAKSPLTHEGFTSAWEALVDRFENKRLLVNSQLKVLFNLTEITSESGAALKELQGTIQGCLTALTHSQISIENWDCLLVFLCSTKLPKLTLSLWEQSLTKKAEIPSWAEMNTFLSERYRTLEAIEDVKASNKPQSSSSTKAPSRPSNPSNPRKINTFEAKVNSKPKTCDLCSKENHPVRLCPRFLQMSVDQRSTYIKQRKLCLNCFARGHQLRDCTSIHNCFTCKGRHNTLLHRGDASTTSNAPIPTSTTLNPSQPIQSTSNTTVQNYFAANPQGVLLGTAMISICHLGEVYTARALLDSGSEATFITERLFNIVKLPYQPVQAQVSGLNQAVAAQASKLCHFKISASDKPSIHIDTSAFVLPQLAGQLPSDHIPHSSLKDLPNLQWADPNFYRSSQIDVLIGADILPSIILGGFRPNICGTLIGQETIFGWILTGPISTIMSRSVSSFTTKISINDSAHLENLITKFWEVEDLPVKFPQESDAWCEENFTRTTKRDEQGRYMVTLPFRNPDHIDLGHSRSIALAQFLKNEGRLRKNEDLKEQYDSVIQEYLEMGHMHLVPPNGKSANYYLPHHAVFKPESTTTKVRVVFNASCPTSNGKSLNDMLHPGPVLQSDLTLQILRWRFFRYVFNADIAKMYRQIRVCPDHTPYQRILFRDANGDIRDYELDTVTFGVTCAPFLAIRTLNQLAQDVKSLLPKASHILSTAMYVDDVLAGTHTQPSAISAIKELREALDSAGFPVRKWTSNSRGILKDIPKEHLLREDFLEIDDASTAKTLGIRWQAKDDEFFFVPSDIESTSSLTKREVLSQIAKLFDPAGWLAPVVVRAKIFMQEIWLSQIDWDDSLPTSLQRKWAEFTSSYPALRHIRVPRWIRYASDVQLQYHGFCDASEKAYGAAIFVRIEAHDTISTHLLTAKTRVAPVKTLSLPRLELSGAVLLAELFNAIIPQCPVDTWEPFFWTDSTIVLAWLSKPPCQWNCFVANRVTRIMQACDVKKWSHVRSEYNPADLASRGVSPQDLVSSDLWWHGPSWLKQPQSQWPAPVEISHTTDLEQRKVKCNIATSPPADILERFSELGRALRAMSYAQRFVSRCRKSSVLYVNDISSKELAETQDMLIKATQRIYFQYEYRCLSRKVTSLGSSSLRNLNPFLDQKGMIRASGRLTASTSLRFDERYPILLPYNCVLAKLLVKFTHRISLHGGNQLVTRLLRSKFWIPKIKNLVKATLSSCKQCTIHRRKLQTQLMGELPSERSTFSRPFTHTGVDFAGPFDIKNYTGRACLITKGYVCVFVCFSTKAIHLEATSDLTSEKFLAAFARFAARRGCPSKMYSDNGKTFVGASTIISQDFLQATKDLVSAKYSHQNLSWSFNPPSAPHMGGLWEAGVKSFKTLFYRSTATTKYTFEELSTLLAKIEACLNSRPISPMSEDPADLLALTPGHFLIGDALLSPPEPEIKGDALSIINRWQRLKALHQQFCFRWKEEYLKELHKRNKWQTPTRNIQVNDMVIIKEDNVPTNEWRLGRVHAVFPGTDHIVRVVDVQTVRGIIRRPIAKLVLLPIEADLPLPQ